LWGVTMFTYSADPQTALSSYPKDGSWFDAGIV
jgi:hypothetical protein